MISSSLSWTFKLVLLICMTLYCVLGDQGFYVNSHAAFVPASNINLLHPPKATCEILTSSTTDAETYDTIYVVLMGDFSNSGPHILNDGVVFQRGSTVQVSIQLDRRIGNLVSIQLQTKGFDAWLPSQIECSIGNIRYEVAVPLQWLDKLDPVSEALYGDGFSPNAQDPTIPSSSNIEMPVKSSALLYTVTGLVTAS